ncbi:MAG: DUF4328 domain-containing protein [Deltaproteobacteria bacterium]|nr:DUF4328 domain-containing protein [Deltaproteobacteria bacterium]
MTDDTSQAPAPPPAHAYRASGVIAVLFVLTAVMTALLRVLRAVAADDACASPANPKYAAAIMAALSVLALLPSLVSGILRLVVLRRLHINQVALGRTGAGDSPKWVIIGFFIPILCWFHAHDVVTRLWRFSGPSVEREARVPWVLRMWAPIWALSGMVAGVASVLDGREREPALCGAVADWLAFGAGLESLDVLIFAGFVFAMRARQRAMHRVLCAPTMGALFGHVPDGTGEPPRR